MISTLHFRIGDLAGNGVAASCTCKQSPSCKMGGCASSGEVGRDVEDSGVILYDFVDLVLDGVWSRVRVSLIGGLMSLQGLADRAICDICAVMWGV